MLPGYHLFLITASLLLLNSPHVAAMSDAPSPSPGHDIHLEISTAQPTPMTDLTQQVTWEAVTPSETTIWQGMDHAWRRYILAPKDGRIPHRISTLTHMVHPSHSAPSNWEVTFGQDTGVDGNYMHPISRHATFNGDAMHVRHGHVQFRWRDELENTEGIPQARNQLRYWITLPYSEKPPALALQGLDLNLNCNNSNQPPHTLCNSDGIWPYLFALQIERCNSTTATTRCLLKVDIYRSWTPNKGGVPDIGEIKPLNHSLNYDLKVYFAAFQQTSSNLIEVSTEKEVLQSRSLLDEDDASATIVFNGKEGLDQGIVILTGFGFTLTPPDKVGGQWAAFQPDTRQRGRYLARLKFGFSDSEYDANTGQIKATTEMHIWSPKTVVDSRVQSFVRGRMIQYSDSSAPRKASSQGQLCLNSKADAPFYSLWKKCDLRTPAAIKKFGGQQRARQSLPIGN